MKKDKLLQHQLARLNKLLRKRNPDIFLPSTADEIWWDKFCDIQRRAILRSLKRYASSI